MGTSALGDMLCLTFSSEDGAGLGLEGVPATLAGVPDSPSPAVVSRDSTRNSTWGGSAPTDRLGGEVLGRLSCWSHPRGWHAGPVRGRQAGQARP